LQFHEPTGTVRFSVHQPTVGDCDPTSENCMDNWPAKSSLNYCCRDKCKPAPDHGPGACRCPDRNFMNYDCLFYDGEQASVDQRFGVFITTRFRTEFQRKNASCIGADTCAKFWDIESKMTNFVAGIDQFSVLVDHAAQVPEIGFFQQARDIVGLLRIKGDGPKQQALCKGPWAWDSPFATHRANKAPCYIEASHPVKGSLQDVFLLSTLLTAASVDLDEASYAGSGHSARFEGMTMLLSIKWFNTAPWVGILGKPGYVYELDAMPKNAYGLHQTIWAPKEPNRTVISAHGILLQANILGEIGGFNFNGLLLQLTASMTLLAVASFAVNFLATSVLKYKDYYNHAMTDLTADFSDVAVLEAMTLEALQDTCRRRFVPHGGSKVELISRLVADGYQHQPGSRGTSTVSFSSHGPSEPLFIAGRDPA